MAGICAGEQCPGAAADRNTGTRGADRDRRFAGICGALEESDLPLYPRCEAPSAILVAAAHCARTGDHVHGGLCAGHASRIASDLRGILDRRDGGGAAECDLVGGGVFLFNWAVWETCWGWGDRKRGNWRSGWYCACGGASS